MGSNGTTRRRFSISRLLPLLVLGLAAVLPRAGWCGGTVGDGHLTLQADSGIIGGASHATDTPPIAVTITNSGDTPVNADLTVRNEYEFNGHRLYHRAVTIPGGGMPAHYLLYPNSGDNYNPIFLVEMTTRYGELRTQVTTAQYGYTNNGNPLLCLIGTRLGVLSPIPHHNAQPIDLSYYPAYVKPENAPTRPGGYRGVGCLAVSRDVAAHLSAEQTLAIRRWVTAGGSLIFLGATSDSAYAAATTPFLDDFAALLPVRLTANQAVPGAPSLATATIPFSQAAAVFPEVDFRNPANQSVDVPIVGGELLPGATNLSPNGSTAWLARRYLGAGTVVYCGIDPTSREMRSQNYSLNSLWRGMIHLAAPYAAFKQLQVNPDSAPWVTNSTAYSDGADENTVAGDPFHLALPALREVLYLFLVYFVLAVPVTFVVLKRTRRMNLAWATGPILAVIFAGAFCLFSIRLYSEPLSRRTSGVLVAASGDREAQFSGYTEIFFPHGGSYDVSVPNADTMEVYSNTERASGVNNVNVVTFETYDDGNAVSAPDLGVANLAFRRVFHTQTVDMGGGVVANLKHVTDCPHQISGTITNNTGTAIENTVVKLATSDGTPWSVNLGTLKPGVTKFDEVIETADDGGRFDQGLVLVGYMPGAAFGPQLGKSVGGDTSVKLVVSLPLTGDGKN